MAKNIAFETLNMIDLFELNSIKSLNLDRNIVILHIPHSSKRIPDYSFFTVNKELIFKELELLTDLKTHEIFNFKVVDRIITPFSRIFCDVERFIGASETMEKFGRGYYYTKTDSGKKLRDKNYINEEKIKDLFYNNHHSNFTKLVDKKLNKYNKVIIIDCHSFNDKYLETDIIKENNRPDFCIGTDDFHTPKDLTENLVGGLKDYGFKVLINNPYSGTIVPEKHLNNNKNVKSIMIEINKKLYIKNNVVDLEKIKKLNLILSEILFG